MLEQGLASLREATELYLEEFALPLTEALCGLPLK